MVFYDSFTDLTLVFFSRSHSEKKYFFISISRHKSWVNQVNSCWLDFVFLIIFKFFLSISFFDIKLLALSFVIFSYFLLCVVIMGRRFIGLTQVYPSFFFRPFFNWYNFIPFSRFFLNNLIFFFIMISQCKSQVSWVNPGIFFNVFFRIIFF